MPDFNAWLGLPSALDDDAQRAVRAWRRIQDRPSSVVLIRGGVDQTAQTVRIEYERVITGMSVSETGQTPVQRIIIFGVKGHPDGTVLNTSLQVNDRFRYDGRWFELTSIVEHPGEIQGFGEAQKFGP